MINVVCAAVRRRLLVFVLALGLTLAQRRQVGTAPWTGADTPWPAGDAAAAGFDTARLEAAARLAGSTHADALRLRTPHELGAACAPAQVGSSRFFYVRAVADRRDDPARQ